MLQFDSPAQYVGKPEDVVLARRVEGHGHVRLEPSELQPGMPPCACHLEDPDRPETSFAVIHEGDVIRMRRGECVGFFRSFSERPHDPDWPLTHVWNSGRADFEYASEEDGSNLYDDRRAAQRAAKRTAKQVAEATEAAQPAVPETDQSEATTTAGDQA